MGSACTWPSVLRLGLQFWIHLYDFQTFHSAGCDTRNYLQSGTMARRGLTANHRLKGHAKRDAETTGASTNTVQSRDRKV